MNLQDIIYEFGHVMYQIGRCETDEKQSTKDYNKLIKRKEELHKLLDDHFKSVKSVSKTLNLI